MKISSVGINAYQEMVEPRQSMKNPPPASPEQNTVTKSVHIPDRVDRVGSRLSIKLENGDYSKILSPEEKQALELLFKKFGDGRGLSDISATSRPALGNFVDVKL
jgi:hypothetical protein